MGGNKNSGAKQKIFTVIEGTIIPDTFFPLYKTMKKYGRVKNSTVVSQFYDDNGIFLTIMFEGASKDRMKCYLNLSHLWTKKEWDEIIDDYFALKFKKSKKRKEMMIYVNSDVESQRQLLDLAKKWKRVKNFVRRDSDKKYFIDKEM